MAGLLGLPAESIYTATKYAAEGFTESLYWECKPLGILVKSVAPGVVTYKRYVVMPAMPFTACSSTARPKPFCPPSPSRAHEQ